jgi:transcriptional regulator with XRE-family HTH domain
MIHPSCKIDAKLDAKDIGRRIRAARKSYGWSIGDLAERVGRASATVAAWECGARIARNQDTANLSRVLRRTVDFLWFGTRPGAYPFRTRVVNQTGFCGGGSRRRRRRHRDDPARGDPALMD